MTGNRARLTMPEGGYEFAITSTLAISLPANVQNITTTVKLAYVGGQAQLSGALSGMSLTVAGATLAMKELAFSNEGVSVVSATLTLPASLGSASASISGISITNAGLVFAQAQIALPDINIGSGKLVVSGITATVSSETAGYAFSAHGRLSVTLPGTSAQADLTFAIDPQGNASGQAASLSLTVAGANLAMRNLAFDNSGVSVYSATLTLPASLGSASASIQGISITQAGLVFAQAEIGFPDIKFGDGSKVKVTGARALLKTKNARYGFDAQGTLLINLPGNPPQTVSLAFSMEPDGNLKATIVKLDLTLAGCKLSIDNMSLSNAGLAGEKVSLTLPASLGGASGAVSGLKITKDGISFDQVSILLPDIKFGDGSKVKLQRLTATLTMSGGVYKLDLSGTLSLRLPDNSQDIPITASLDSNGNLSASISGSITLKIATASLTLSGVTLNNAGLTVASASLKLPNLLGGVEGALTDVKITKDGLSVGGGAATVSFPDFSLGGASTNLKVSGARLKIEFSSNGSASSYKLTLSGTLSISVAGQSASASGTVSIDNAGHLSGSVASFSLSIAGLTLEAKNIRFSSDASLSIELATLKLPAAFGGGGATLQNVTISKDGALSIGGGSFELPTISVGGFKLQLSGSLLKVGNDYQISAHGTIAIPGFGAAVGCSGIQVGVVLYATQTGQTVLQILPAEATYAAYTVPAPYGPAAPGGYSLKLKEATLGMVNCKIPVASTGVYITALSGHVTLDGNSTQVNVKLSLTAGPTLFGMSVLSGDLDTTLTTDPFSLVMLGTIKLFSIQVGGADAKITSNSFSANLWIDMKYLQGKLAVNAWSDTRGFHLTGSAQLTLAIDKGSIASYCVPVPHCSTSWVHGRTCWGRRWWRTCVNWSYPVVSCWLEDTCVTIPPWNIHYSVGVDVGEFSNGAWGFKGYVTILGANYGFYIDSRNNIVFGNVESYRLVTPATVLKAQRAAKLRAAGAELPDSLREFDYIRLNAAGEIVIDVPITQTREAIFSLARLGDAPTLSLVAPDGTPISPANLPAGVEYHEFVTYTVKHGQAASSTFSLLPAAETRTLAGDGLRLSLCASQAPASGQPSLAGSLPVPERIARHMGDDWGGVAVQLPASAAEAAAGATSAQLRFLHAWPDAGALDVWVDDDPYASNLGRYGLSRYIALAEGRHAIQVTPAGITSTLLVSTSVDLAQYTDYTFVLLGAERGHWLLVDENMPLPQGHALLRLVHLAPGTPAVDLTDPYGSYYAGDVPFKTASRYVELVGGRHDVQVRLADQAAILLDTSALTLTQGSIYSVFLVGTAGITPGLQLVSSLDAAPPSQVRFVNAVAGGPDVDVLHAWPGVTPQASLAWSSVPYSQVTAYAADPGELAQFIVTPAGVSTTHLISLTLDLEGGQDYTMVAAGQPGNIVPLWLKDDNRLPALGQARLRLVALSPDAPAVDLAVRNGPALVENVAYQAASRYAQLAGGVYDLEIRQAGSSTELASLPGLALKEGQVYSLFLVGLPGGYNAVLNTDLATDKNSQVLYQVRQAQVGTWQAVLGGDVKPDGTYVFKALGMVPAPQLSDVSVSLRDATEAEVAWRLTSPQADTKISIFANPGPITTTSIVTGSDGLTATIEIPYFAGQRLAHGLSGSDASWVNGSPQSYTLDLLGSLPSGTYHVWIEALEEHNPPTRVYIPTPIQVVLPWADNWQAGLAAVASYRTLNVSWQDNPSADVDEYILYASDQSTQTMQHELGDAHHFSLTGLDPAQAYTLWIDAVDTRTGRVSHSEQITACPRSAPFSLSVEPPGLEFSNGQSRTFTVTLRTPLATYPNVVRLYGVDEEELRLDAVDLHTAFAQDTVTPTRAGVVVTGTVFAPKTAAEGSWSEVIMAAGGGDLRYAYLPVTVTNPYIDLRVTPDRIVLGEGESVSLSVDIRHFQNHTEPVELSVDGLQDLSYALSQDVVWPGQSARLLITDTQRQSATGDGDRDDRPFIQLWASSSLAASSHTIYYDIVKPDFRVERPQTRPVERVNILAGESVTLPFEARSLNGWAQPVSAVYLQHTTLPSTTVHLHSGDGVPLDMHVPITPPLSMYLQVDSTPDTPLSTRGYELELCGVNVRSGCARYELGVYAPGAIFTDLYAHLHQRAQAGDLITYTWHVGNAGPLAASNLVVTITLPPGTTLSSVQQGECVLAGEQVVCSLGDAPRQGQFVVEMTLQVDPGLNAKEVSLDGNCTITADQQDLDRGDTELCVDPLPQQDYDLEVSMSAGPGPVWAGQELVYTITVRNAGPGPVPRVNVYNALPWATTVVALDDRCFTYVTDVSCNLGPLEPGETATLQSTLQLPLHVGGVLVNIARASSFVDPLDRIKGFDVDLHNNYAALYTPIQEGEAPQPPAHPVYLPIVLRGM
ncbi:MAG: DUF4397 domain-containing protein [Thermoflexales bacterium]|nr:DUF4397 domain-containing protein [Thermoflexales bacterium]